MTIGPGAMFFESKNDLEWSIAGVMGVAGDDPSIEESSALLALRKVLSNMDEKSVSLAELTELADEDVDDTDLMSGAVNA